MQKSRLDPVKKKVECIFMNELVPPFSPTKKVSNLNNRQRALHQKLLEKNKRLADMYLGALIVLDDNERNPERFSQASHSIRELIDKIPKCFDIDTHANKESLKEKVMTLERSWLKATEKSICHDSICDGWKGEIDEILQSFLKATQEFFEWREKHLPRKADEIKKALRKLDNSERTLPFPLENHNVTFWSQIKDFFLSVCHHGKDTDPKEFGHWLESFEIFLLDRLYPRTYEEFDKLDSIIAEGEKDEGN